MDLKILIISDDVVGKKMAGPGIRAWEISCELSKFFKVSMMVPEYSEEGAKKSFDIIKYSEKKPEALINKAKEFDVLIVQGYVLNKFKELSLLKKIIIVDLYVPFVLENMFNYMFKLKDKELQFIFKNDLDVYHHQLMRGDLFLVANQDQLNLIAGGLLLLGRINPELVSKKNKGYDPIIEIPFGFKENHTHEKKWVLKEKIGFKKSDFLLIWGGVITNWFDPITLIKAMRMIGNSHPNIKLIFLSTTHANPFLPEFDMAKIAEAKARELNLYNRTVLFNREWIPYEERGTYFGAADIGVSMHNIHIETRYSFRTRFLDYLNFDLPIVSTEGDYLSESLGEKGALIKVKENDVNGLKNVLIKLYEDKHLYDSVLQSVKREKGRYTWERVLKPLIDRLKTIERQFKDNFSPNLFPHRIKNRKMRRFLKKTFPFMKRFENKPIFIKLRRYFGH